jgi:2-hydroxy-3-keto-5-methylthiopentenyl-1-phosphate phosphatase
MIVLCDFDGTITFRDVTTAVWNRHVPDWRARILPASEAGEIPPYELIRRGYAEVPAPPDELLQMARAEGEIRAGFGDLVALCRRRAWPLRVVSNGLRCYIEALLPPGLPVTAFEGTHDGRAWRVRPPDEVTRAVGAGSAEAVDLKQHVLDRLRAERPGDLAAYIGDGRLDFPAARRSDIRFAVRGSALARLCAQAGLSFQEFDDFAAVTRALEDAERAPLSPAAV